MVEKSDLQFFYTSVEPFVSQMNPSQSIGGYPSDSVYSQSGTLISPLGIYSTNIPTDTMLPGTNLLVDDEIIQTQGVGTDHAVLARGALSTAVRPHIVGAPVYSIPSQPLFNNALSSNLSQYRCIAVKNTNPVSAFNNISFYFKNLSLTPFTTVQMAIEVPRTEYYTGSVLSGSVISVVDTGLLDYPDNYFVGCAVKILSGVNAGDRRTIISFDSSTTTFVLDSSLPLTVSHGDTYEIQNAPAQTISGGTSSPVFRTSNVSGLATPTDLATSLGINITGARENGVNLAPNEVIYLWLVRTRETNAPAQLNNRILFTAHYTG